MAEPIGALRGELSLSAAQFEQDIKAARSALRREAAGMETAMKSFQARTDFAIRSLANFSVIAAGAATAAFGFSKVAISAADNIAKTADKVGVTTDELQKYRFAAELSGVATTVMDTALQRLARRTGEAAQGTGVLVKLFEQYGIAATDAEGNARSTADVFRDIAEAMQNAGSEQERLRIAVAAFDTEGAGLVNMLRNGTAGLDQMTSRADQLGIVIDSALVRKAEVANDRMTELQYVMRANASVMALEMMPAVEALAEAMTSPRMLEGIGSLSEGFAHLISIMAEYNRAIVALVSGGLAAKLPVPPWFKLLVGAGTAIGVYAMMEPEAQKLNDALANQIAEVERLEHAWRQTADPEIARGIHEQMMAAVEAAAETRRQLRALEDGAPEPGRPAMPSFEMPSFEPPSIPGLGAGADNAAADRMQREEDMRKAAIERELEAIRESLMTREELETQAQERRLETLRAGLEAGILTEQEFGELRLETELATMDRLAELRDQQLEDERRIADERMQIQQQAEDFIRNQKLQTATLAANLLQTMAGKSRAAALAALALNKAVAVANIVITTAQAAAAALAPPPLGLGPVAGAPLAAQMKAFGAAQIGLVLATGLAQAAAGSTGASTTAGGSGGSGAAAASSGVGPSGIGRGGVVEVRLDSRRSRYTAEEVKDIAEQLVELIGDGFDAREIRVRS